MKDFESRRQGIVDEIPSSYNKYVHLIVPSLIVAAVLICSILWMGQFSFVTAALTIFALFGFEWFVHKNILHKPVFGLKSIYRQHTLHHIIFTDADMAIRDGKELSLVLMPAYAVVLVLLLLVPLSALLGWLFSLNVALSMVIAAMSFFFFYEWLHLLYHLPDNHWLVQSKIIKFLRQQHQTHHNIKSMLKYNFNVTVPVFDWIMGTFKR